MKNLLEQFPQGPAGEVVTVTAGSKPTTADFVVRPQFAGRADISDLFKIDGVTVKVDPLFQEFLDSLGEDYSDIERLYEWFKTEAGAKKDTDIITGLDIMYPTTPSEVRANLQYLSDNFEKFLAIPNGEEEINFILGYVPIGDENKLYVFYVEHEFEDGAHEVHLHARPIDRWGNDFPQGLKRQTFS